MDQAARTKCFWDVLVGCIERDNSQSEDRLGIAFLVEQSVGTLQQCADFEPSCPSLLLTLAMQLSG